jgi:mxaJ protein
MSSRCLSTILPAVLAVLAAAVAFAIQVAYADDAARELRVCADPDNLPYSHENESGFENRIASLIAEEMHATLRYDWLPQRRGYVRKTMGAGLCDVFIGVPVDFERVMTTRPYYRSSYVFVYRKGEQPIDSFTKPLVTTRRIGVQLVGNDLAATPPGHALTRAGATDNVVGYTVYGEGPAAARMVAAVASREIDAALVWGPQAGYFMRRSATPLMLAIANPPEGLPVPFEFAIAMGVKRGNRALRDELNAIIERRRVDIDAILAQYGVPRTDVRTEAGR